VKILVAQLEAHVEHDQKTTRHADGEAQYVDERVAFVFAQIAQRDFEVVVEHG
jgi:hypothetical protein